MKIESPPNVIPRIDSLYAYLSVDEDGNEGLCAFTTNGMTIPLIASDEVRLKEIGKIAEYLAANNDKRIKLVQFTMRTELREVTGVMS